ncbi:MAG: thiamine pyrophosphate-binding protein [bacterium]|nr:thiamine pyrophosphate-binding protein [bacterium]
MKFADFLVEGLEELETKYIFGVAGDIQIELHRALEKASIEFVAARNEKSAVFMADCYARVSGRPGVCFSTLGPGITNMITGLANATDDRSSVVAISDHVQLSELEIPQAHQYIPVEKVLNQETGIVKEGYVLRNGEEAKRLLAEAFKTAQTEYRGAVHIAIPADVYAKDVRGEGHISFEEISKEASLLSPMPEGASQEIFESINGKKNIIIFGGSPTRIGINKEVLEFVEAAGLAVMTTFRGKGTIPESHPRFLTVVSRHLQGVIEEILEGADNILLVGYDYNEGLKPSIWKGQDDKIINLEVVDNRVDGVFSPERSYFGDLKSLFGDLAQREYETADWIDEAKTREKVKKSIYKDLDLQTHPFQPHRIIEAVNEVFPDAIKVCDVGLNKYYSGLLLRAETPGSILFSNGQSSMAFSSGALGAKLAAPEKRVVVLVGDGGFLMDPQEILTAVRYKAPITVIIFNDSALGLVKRKQRLGWNGDYGTSFENPDYVQLASSFGAKGYSVTSVEELPLIMEAARKNDEVMIIDVPVDYTKGI